MDTGAGLVERSAWRRPLVTGSVSICAASVTPCAAARARQTTVAAFAREVLVEAIGRPSTLPEVIAAQFGRAEIVKLTLRVRQHEAEALVLKAIVRHQAQ